MSFTTVMEQIKEEIPAEYSVSIVYDFTKFERNAVREVKQT